MVRSIIPNPIPGNNLCLSYCSNAVKGHHDQHISYKRKDLIGSWLLVSKSESGVWHVPGEVAKSFIYILTWQAENETVSDISFEPLVTSLFKHSYTFNKVITLNPPQTIYQQRTNHCECMILRDPFSFKLPQIINKKTKVNEIGSCWWPWKNSIETYPSVYKQ